MALTFHKRPADSERGNHHAALVGGWPKQTRLLIEKRGWEWNITTQAHIPGKGFVTIGSANFGIRTLKAAKERCEEMVNPKPTYASAETDG